MKNLQKILIWGIGIMFIGISILKYLDLDTMSREVFSRAHLPEWFFYVVATLEFAGGMLLLMTASTSKRLGILVIAFLMAGAFGTRWLLHEHGKTLVLPGVVFVIALLMYFSLGKEKQENH